MFFGTMMLIYIPLAGLSPELSNALDKARVRIWPWSPHSTWGSAHEADAGRVIVRVRAGDRVSTRTAAAKALPTLGQHG